MTTGLEAYVRTGEHDGRMQTVKIGLIPHNNSSEESLIDLSNKYRQGMVLFGQYDFGNGVLEVEMVFFPEQQ